MEFLRQLVAGVVQVWHRLSVSARINIIVAGLATLALVVGMTVWVAQPQYVVLYQNLSQEDSAAIRSYLDQQGVPHGAKDDGQTILVPLRRRTDLRVALRDEGLPKDKMPIPGFEIFDREDVMTSQRLHDVNFMRAVQGTLMRQLNELDFVKRSHVYIREAKEELFVSEQEPSTASVTLDVTRPLTRKEVSAVLGIISSFGGPNLHKGNISLTTTDGTPLHVPARDEFASIANSKLEFVRELEAQREQRAEQALAQFGVNAVVRVSADIDFSHVKKMENRSSEGAVVSSWTTESSTTTKELLPEGPVGATAHLPEGMAVPGGVETEETMEETIENFEPSTTTTETVIEPGDVKKYRVAAFIEGHQEPILGENGEETGETEYKPLTPEEIQKYTQFIAAAVGVGVEAGDITVFDHPFDIGRLAVTRAAFEEIEVARVRDTVLQWIGNGLKVLLVVAGFLFMRWLLRRAMVLPVAKEEEEVEIPEVTPGEFRRRQIAEEVEHLSHEDPAAVAALLRSWMGEEEG